jgi:GT2 family glycosyltransferase
VNDNPVTAPSVVAVMVVHEPDAGFDSVLESLAEQDYPNLKSLFLVAGEAADLPARIREKVPSAFVRAVAGNPGFGAAANEVLRLVEGDNGFFLLMHDDVALEPDATRLLVEELYRSNAGIVGPKLVMWDEPHVLQHVGLGVDRFGEIDPLVEPGEVDQEQHDAVRDVFALTSACMLVRADLFRVLGGFDTATSFHGEDVDLCWRAHLGGARVVVVPTATARHRENLAGRRPDLPHRLLAARQRVRSVATLTGGLRLPLTLLELVLISLLEMVVGLFTGRLGEAFASLRATVGLVPRIGTIINRRREVASLRHVPYREVVGLQIRGSARLASYLRTREQHQTAVDHSSVGVRRFARNTSGQLATWLSIMLLALIGSRSFIVHGVPKIGEYLPFGPTARSMLGDFWSGWWGHGLGRTTPVPTGMAIIGGLGVASLGKIGLLHTLAVVAWLPIGYYGAWKLMSIFPSSRARIAGLIAFAAVPLPYSALGAGRWGVVAAYGACPWVVHLLRNIASIEPALTARADADVVDAFAPRSLRDFASRIAALALLTALVTAFTPAFAAIVVVIAVFLALGTLVARGSIVTALVLVGGGVVAALVAVLVNLPWFTTLFGDHGWDTFVGAPAAHDVDLGVAELLHFSVGPDRFGALAIALWVPVLAAPLLARGWRLTWAARGGVLAVGSLALAVFAISGTLSFRLPEIGLLLAPAAVGISLSAACAAAAFEQDVQGGSFGWRQPLGIVCGIAIVFGAIPAVAATANGHWSTPTSALLPPDEQFGVDRPEGDWRVLYIGDSRVMPLPGWRLDDDGESGVSFAIVNDGPLSIRDRWAGLPSSAERDVRSILGLMAENQTARIGRLLAPYAIRYIVVPVLDGVDSTNADPVPLPAGLVESLTAQLDLSREVTLANYIAFENTAWIPTQSTLSDAAAEASLEAGPEALASQDLSGSTPAMVGMRPRGPGGGPVPAGVFHYSVPYDTRWRLTVDGVGVESRVAFDGTTAFDVPAAGAGELTYHTDTGRHIAVFLEALAWLALAVVASKVRWSWLRRFRRPDQIVDEGPVLSLGEALTDSIPWQVEPTPVGSGEVDAT